MPLPSHKRHSLNRDEAETLAIEALSFLAADEGRLASFLNVTGLIPSQIRTQAGSAEFLAGILEFVAADESLLLVFSSERGIDPDTVLAARRSLLPNGADSY